MIRKIAGLAALLILGLALSCGAAQPAPIPTPQAPQEKTFPVVPPPQAIPKAVKEEPRAPIFAVSRWEIENKFPKGMRLIVDVQHTFPLDLAASRLEMRMGKNTSWQVAPEVDHANLNPSQIVFVLKGSGSFYTWTEIDNGRVTIKDKEGHEVILETGPFVYRDTRFPWNEASSQNLRVLFYGPQDAVQPENALKEAEELLKKFSFTPAKKIRIIVYEARQDIDVALPFRSKATEEHLVTLGMAFKDINAVFVLRRGSSEEVANTRRHELMHLIFDYLTKNVFVPLPTWLNEGLAMYAGSEDFSDDETFTIRRAVESGNLLSLRQISSFSGDPQLTMLSYAESHSFVRFLIQDYGQDTMLNLFRFLNENFGMTFEKAIEEVYGKPLDTLENEWKGVLTTGER